MYKAILALFCCSVQAVKNKSQPHILKITILNRLQEMLMATYNEIQLYVESTYSFAPQTAWIA